ncbi:MAG: TolC family protein [Acidobacteriota bacterium]
MVGARAETIDIAIIGDGDGPLDRETRNELVDELTGLSDFELTFRFPESLQRSHGWRVDDARRALEAALADPSVDIVIALDILSSSVASELEPGKPLIATTVIDPQLQGFELTASGTSATENLHFLAATSDLADAVREFQRHTGVRHVGLVVDGSLFAAIPSLPQVTARVRSELDFELSLLEAPSDDFESWPETVPAEVDGLFVTPLPRVGPPGYRRLIRAENDRRWPTFSSLGRAEVDAGFLMGRRIVPTPRQLARRLAIDIRDIALGRPASDLPVGLEVRDRLVLNRSTADAIGFAPSFELIFTAEILEPELDTGRVLTLRGAVDEGLARNLGLAISRRDVDIATQETLGARGRLRPQAGGTISWNRRDRDLVGVNPTRTLDAGISLSQSIYSESLRSTYRATALLEVAEQATQKGTELDTIETVALTYLRVLVAKTERDIQIDNLAVTRANLERAQFRAEVGSADRSEVFRFESELGNDQQNVTLALAAYERLRFELNRVLRQPIDLAFQTEEAGIQTPELFGDERVLGFLQGPEGIERLGAFLAAESLRNAPELAAIRARIEAQERLLLAARRRPYVPTVDAMASATETVDDGGALFETDFDTDWSVGIELTWSFFEGGGIEASRRQAAIELDQLRLTLQQTADRIEADVRSRLADAASTRLNIGFAESSAEAARQTLDLVTDSYSRGSASYIDLIDAQNNF